MLEEVFDPLGINGYGLDAPGMGNRNAQPWGHYWLSENKAMPVTSFPFAGNPPHVSARIGEFRSCTLELREERSAPSLYLSPIAHTGAEQRRVLMGSRQWPGRFQEYSNLVAFWVENVLACYGCSCPRTRCFGFVYG